MTEALLAALGIAVSPFAVIPAILLLFSDRRAATSGGFAGGWVGGIVLVAAAAVLLADVITLPDTPPAWASWTRAVLGGALILAGATKVLRRNQEPEAPAWLSSLERSTPARAARFGLVGSTVNPKVALLAVAGGFSIGAALHGPAVELAAVLAFGVVAGSTAVLPVLAYSVLGERVLGPLGRAKDWLTANADLAVSGVLLALGVALGFKGLSAL